MPSQSRLPHIHCLHGWELAIYMQVLSMDGHIYFLQVFFLLIFFCWGLGWVGGEPTKWFFSQMHNLSSCTWDLIHVIKPFDRCWLIHYKSKIVSQDINFTDIQTWNFLNYPVSFISSWKSEQTWAYETSKFEHMLQLQFYHYLFAYWFCFALISLNTNVVIRQVGIGSISGLRLEFIIEIRIPVWS